MARFELRDSDYSFNASLDAFMVLKKMGFTEHSMYQEGDIVRVHCPIHKDLVRKSLIVDTSEKTFKCQYANCDAHEGGLLIELVGLYYDCEIRDVSKALFGEEDKSADLLFRGEMFINQGRHLDALPYLEQATDLNPRDEITRCKLAALYLELNRKDDAYREYLNAAESYAVRGELDKTLSIYNILIMLQPGAVKARKELSFLFSRMGRPDAAAEQLKWVVDFYMKYNQLKGAQEACEQIIEMDPESGMAHFLMGKLMSQTGKRIQAVQSYEMSCRLFIKAEDLNRAEASLAEALELAPTNGRLADLREQLEHEIASLPEADRQLQRMQATISATEEQEFIDWLQDVDSKLATGVEPPLSREDIRIGLDGLPIRSSSPENPRPPGLDAPAPDTAEISPEDRRVAMCLNDMSQLDSDQIEAMRQQLVGMFTDVRKSFEEGSLSDWEMRTIKEFYKSFCMAVDMHRKGVR
jgi:tetratricopeptide (TPR) repeat protein